MLRKGTQLPGSSRRLASSIAQLTEAFRKGERKPSEEVAACIRQYEGHKALNAFITHTGDSALKSAIEADERYERAAPQGRLDGVVLAVKDNFCTKDVRTTCASKMLETFVPTYTATVVSRLVREGAIIVGKTNMDEFGMGSFNLNTHFGPALNPKTTNSTQHVSGGSSGGSAVAVAAGMATCAVGSDTGGSSRLPAAYCGVVGWKPSTGRLSRHGLVAYASSLDSPAVLAGSVSDAALLGNIMSGADPRDATCMRQPMMDFLPSERATLAGVTVGIPAEYWIEELPEHVLASWRRAADALQARGARVVSVSLPTTRSALPAYYIIASAEASSNLSRYDGLRYGHRAKTAEESEGFKDLYASTRQEGFGSEVIRRILTGTFTLSRSSYDSYFQKAQQIRRLVSDDFARVFADGVTVLLTPTAPGAAPSVSEARMYDAAQSFATDVFTTPASLAGLPALSIPAGSAPNGLPLGLQLLGKRQDDASVLMVGKALEEELA